MKFSWTKKADSELISSVNKQHSVNIDWNKVVKEISSHPNPSQALHRFNKLKKNLGSKQWSSSEDEKLTSLHDQLTEKSKTEHKLPKGGWEIISKSLGRPKNSCIFRYYLLKDAFRVKTQGATRKFVLENKTAKRVDGNNVEEENQVLIDQKTELETENEVFIGEQSEEEEYIKKVEESDERDQNIDIDSNHEEEIEDFRERKPAISLQFIDNNEWECTLSLLKLPELKITPNIFGYHFNPNKNIQEKIKKSGIDDL